VKLSRIAWLDVETTGNDPDRDLLLEAAVIVTTAGLVELERESCVVRWPARTLAGLGMDPVVRDMHTANGLLAECSGDFAVDLDEVDERLFGVIARNVPEGHGGVHLGGCSVWLDRSMAKRFLPETYSLFLHRDMNVSSIRDFFQAYAGLDPKRARKPHRALADCEDAIKLLRKYKLELQRLYREREAVCV
jgi:oligoribonuclease